VFQALDVLGTFSTLDRVRKCRRVPTGHGQVEVRLRADAGRAHYSGLQTCGSVWSCPLCSEKILAGRADELLAAIDAHSASGGEVLMLTLTMRHRSDQALGALWDALGEGWRAASSGSRSVRDHLAGVDWVRRVEATHGAAGWHVHVHALLFVQPGADADALGEAMFAAWRKRLVSLGLDAPLAGPGMQIKRLDLANAAGEVADYLAKGRYEEAVPSRRLAALELASAGKAARAANRTPMQVLADFVARGEASDALLWREWEAASKGRRALTWSRGARARLVPDEELSDEELAQETDGGGQVVACIDPAAWLRIIRRPRLAAALLTITEAAEVPEAAFTLLDAHLAAQGLSGAVFRPPRALAE
jgi:hypothetical protein